MNRLPSNHDIIIAYSKSDVFTWNAVTAAYDLSQLDPGTAAKYSHIDDDGRRFQLTSLLHPEQGKRPNLDYEVMGVRRTWRWSKTRMEAAIAAGKVVQTAPGRVPREKRYLDIQKGRVTGDVWTDINPLNSQAAERLGYPTQKPLALLERIIRASTAPGDLVLDPFCGCGTTVDATVKMDRQWIGIDITTLAVDLIQKRLIHTYGPDIVDTYVVRGIPRDLAGAHALFKRSPFEFERWAVSLVNATPNQKQVADRGIDGVVRFYTDAQYHTGRVLVSVKGGKTVGPQYVRDLIGTVGTERAEMGTLLTLAPLTSGIMEAVDRAGNYHWPVNGQPFPVAQALTIDDLITGRRRLNAPPSVNPYIAADRRRQPFDQLNLDVG